MTDTARPLGWGRFLVQLLTVAAIYLAGSAPPILILGQTSAGLALSAATGVGGGLLLAWWWLRRDGALAAAFALHRPRSWLQAWAIGLASAGAIVLWFQIGVRLVQWAGFAQVDVSAVMAQVTASPLSLMLWVVLVAWFAAGFGEEMMWRGFLLDRLTRLRGIKGRLWLAIAIQAVLFGLPHAYQGWGGVIVTTVVGVYFGWLRTRTGWNLWPSILGHGLVDSSMMIAGYAARHGLLPL